MKNFLYFSSTLIRTLFIEIGDIQIRTLSFTKSRINPRLFVLLLFFVGMGGMAQGQSIKWNFDAPSANASTTTANLTATALSQGNNNGTTTLITNSSVSTSYTGATGNYNAGAAARTGAIDITPTTGSAYFEFTITPDAGYTFSLTAISFGTRSTGTGPQAYTLRYSTDSYGSDLATGTWTASSAWFLKTNSSLIITSGVATPVTFRIYGYNGTGSPGINTANWRIDDLSLTISAVPASPTLTPSPSTLTGLDYVNGSGPSTSQSFTLTGSNLSPASGNVGISATTTNYEICFTAGGTYVDTLTKAYTGSAFTQAVYVRLKSGLSVGTYSENIKINGGGVSLFTYPVSGTVNRKTITSQTGGDWYTSGTWSGGAVPGNGDNVVINHAVTSTAAITRDAGTTTTVNAGKSLAMGATYTNNGTTTINGTFQLNDGAWATGPTGLVYGAGTGTLVFNKTSAGAYGVGGDAYWPSTNGPVNVTVTGNGITMNVGRTVTGTITVSAASSITGSNVLTSSGTLLLASTLDVQNAGGLVINGTFQINSGNLNSNSPVYGGSSTLIYNATYGPYLEWTSNSSTAGTGVPQNVTIQSGKTLTMPSSNRGIPGNLTINGTLILNATSGDLYVGGNWERASGATFTHNNRAVFFNGNKIQTINATSGQTATFAYLIVGSGSGTTTVKLGYDVIVGSSSQTGSVLQFSNSIDILDLNSRKLTVGTNTVTSDISGSGSFKGSTTSDLELKGTGYIGATIKFTGDLNLRTLTLNRTTNGGFNLGSDLTINSSIVFTSGVITLGANSITFTNTATTSGATALSMIVTDGNGQVKKVFDNSNKTFTYPVGNVVPTNNRIYTPATINFASGTFGSGASVAVNVKPVEQTFTTRPGTATAYLKRYWNVSTTNITAYSATASFLYNTTSPTDVGTVGAGAEADLKIAGYNNVDGGWVMGGSTNTGTHTLSLTSITALQDAYTGGDLFDPIVSNYSDYFRTKSGGSGSWNNKNNWESSADGISWSTATKYPNTGSAGITIKTPLILNIGRTLDDITIDVGGVLTHTNGITLTINNNKSFVVNGTYVIDGNMPAFNTGATMTVNSGGIVRADGNTGGLSEDITFSGTPSVVFKTGSIFEWNNTSTFSASGITFFPNGSEIPIFRISKSPGTPGGGSATTFNGILDVNASFAFASGGAKNFRDGITGSATLTLPSSIGTVSITSSTPILGGSGLIINTDKQINLTSGITVPSGANVKITSSGPGFAKGSGGVFQVDGTLDLTDVSISNGSGSVIVNGTLKTSDIYGLKGTGANISGGTVTINDGSTIEYNNASVSQAISTSVDYYNLTLSGVTKTFSAASSINVNTLGTVSILGSGVLLDASTNNLGTTSPNTTNFIMDGGTLILGTGGTQPNMDGTYTITGGLIKYTSASPQTIRPRAYKNIEIYSANVSSGLGFVRLTTNGTFTIKSGGVYANSNYSIMADGATTGQHVIVESGGKITSNRDGGFYGGSGTVYSAIHSNIAAGNISLDPNSTVELNASGDQTNILDGVTFGHLILSGSGQKIFYGTVDVKGNITNNANFTLNSTTKGFLYLSGTGDQTISGSGNFYLHTMELNKSSGKVLLQQTINQIDNHLTFTNGQLDIGTGVSLNLSDGAGITLGSGDFASTSLGNVVFKGNSLVDGNSTNTINFYPNVYLTPTGAKGVNFGAKSMVYNLLQLDAGSFVNTNAPTYASTSTLKYNIGASYNRSVEWSQITGNGYPYNVQISGNTEFNPTRSDGTFQSNDFKIAGDLTIDNGSSIRMDYGVGTSGTGMLKPLIVLGDLQINGELRASIQAPGDIELNGNWTRGSTGVFYPNDRSVSFLGSSNTSITVSATEHKETFPYLIVNKGTLSTQLSLNDSITITKKFTFSKGTLQLKEADVTFQSTNDNTASLTALNASNTAIAYTGGTATGRFIVERYLPNHWAWHFFSVPTKGSTFNSAWQEGNQPGSGLDPLKNKKPGYGIILTSPLGTSKGFDSISPQPSIKYFNKDSARYFPISRTDSLMDNLGGYMVFVRGDRSVSPNYGASTSTTLRTRGKIYEPGAVADTVKMGKDSFALVGNPYPSAIDFNACDTFNLDASYYVWDPNLTTGYGYGAFQTINNGVVTPGGGGYSGAGPFYIQSGQSFFVKAEADDSARIFIPETAKVDGSGISVFRTGTQKVYGLAPASATLRAQLFRIYLDQPILIDGVVSLFNKDYDNQIDKWDAVKLTNLNTENMGVRSNSKVLAIERKDLPQDEDTIFYKMNNYKIAPYRFLFIADKLDVSGQDAFLYDKYLNTFTPVSPNDTTLYDFTITNATGSWDETRFSIVFKNSKTTPVTLTNLKAYTQNKDIVVEWKVENESNMRSYTVETSTDGKTFIKGGTVAAKNVAATTYQWLDANVTAGYHYYRILSTELDGKSSYSKIVRVLVGANSNASKITIYPNPIKDGVINLQFENQKAGIYQLRLLNTVGQVMMTKTINHPGGNSSELLMLNSTIARGIYNLEITKGNVRVMGEKIVY